MSNIKFTDNTILPTNININTKPAVSPDFETKMRNIILINMFLYQLKSIRNNHIER